MNEEQASEAYWKVVNQLQEIIDSGSRGSKEDILADLEDDFE